VGAPHGLGVQVEVHGFGAPRGAGSRFWGAGLSIPLARHNVGDNHNVGAIRRFGSDDVAISDAVAISDDVAISDAAADSGGRQRRPTAVAARHTP
jgi:hypothetical protein